MSARAVIELDFARREIMELRSRLAKERERGFRQGYIVGALVTTAFGAALTYWWPL